MKFLFGGVPKFTSLNFQFGLWKNHKGTRTRFLKELDQKLKNGTEILLIYFLELEPEVLHKSKRTASTLLSNIKSTKNFLNDEMDQIFSTTKCANFHKMHLILSTINAPIFSSIINGVNSLHRNLFQIPWKEMNFLNNRMVPILLKLQLHQISSTTPKWTEFSQQQMHQNFLHNTSKMDWILSTTNAPKFPQQQQNGLNSLNNKCTQFFQQQKAYSALLSHSLHQLIG